MTLLLSSIMAFVGGFFLNLMPSVFPVIFLQFLEFILNQNQSKARSSVWQFLSGILVGLLILGVVLIILTADGLSLKSDHLQTPIMLSLLALIFFTVGLRLNGFLKFGTLVVDAAMFLSKHRMINISFSYGFLCAIASIPSLTIFLETGFGFTKTTGAIEFLILLFFMGVGLCLPILVVGLVPQFFQFLPKPGAWIQIFKEFLAFPMFFASLWLFWILGNQRGAEAVLFLLFGFLNFYMLQWAYTKFHSITLHVIFTAYVFCGLIWILHNINILQVFRN